MPIKKLPDHIQNLIAKRDNARQSRNYEQSDRLREQIEQAGYSVSDTPTTTTVTKQEDAQSQATLLSIIGSGEMHDAGRKIHDYVLSKINKKDVSIALITTPAGFQPNVDVVYKEYKDFFEKQLQNYHPQITIIPAHSQKEANDPSIVSLLDTADYIVTGPGSPTYTVNQLHDTLLLKNVIDRVKKHRSSLSLSSAASIAFSEYALPVYEIYKVGEPLHWKQGLNVYKELYKPLTIVPHFNNTEGGEKLDTSCCYMGKGRFEALRRMLPDTIDLRGIDEHTGVVIDTITSKEKILGSGSVHVLKNT